MKEEYRPRLSRSEWDYVQAFRDANERRILVIGDLHEPFTKKGYIEHCMAVREKYNTNHTIFIGDVIDNHYASFHATDPDGYGAGFELERTTDRISRWYDEFPEADVVLGNHDRIINRKAFASGISKRWIKDWMKFWKFLIGILILVSSMMVFFIFTEKVAEARRVL